jgi:hypothetical protein
MARDGLFVKDEIETGRNKGQVENTKGVPTGEKGIKSSDRESTEKGEVWNEEWNFKFEWSPHWFANGVRGCSGE